MEPKGVGRYDLDSDVKSTTPCRSFYRVVDHNINFYHLYLINIFHLSMIGSTTLAYASHRTIMTSRIRMQFHGIFGIQNVTLYADKNRYCRIQHNLRPGTKTRE